MTEQERFHFGYVCGDTGLIDEQAAEHQWFIENCCSITDLKKNWKTVCDKLNEVHKENEELKKENKTLTVQKLEIRKWVNDKISDLEKKYEFGQTEYKGCPMHNIQFGINILKELQEYWEEQEND